jgi:hypothetical protein
MSIANPDLMCWLSKLREEVNLTNPRFDALHPTGWPIPFFGDIRTARVLTVGVNPSPTEFGPHRWGPIASDSQWAHRLLNYFHTPGVPWHKWFLPWETSLRLLGCSYEDRTAAHLDLSPRSTTVMGHVGEELRPMFCNMVAGDVHWLYEALPFAPSARLILAAGGMIHPEPGAWSLIGAYLQERAAHNRATIEHIANQTRLISSNGCVSLPIRSFNGGPAAHDRFQLVADVFAARERLVPMLR